MNDKILSTSLEWIERINQDLDTHRADMRQSWRYYRGEPFGDETEGRSQYVSQDVHDVVESILPQLLRIFTSGDEVCSITPHGPEDTDKAMYFNELVNYQLRVRNPWFQVIHDFIKDLLLCRIGVIKYWWHRSEEVVSRTYENLSDMEAVQLLQDPSIAVTDYRAHTKRGVTTYDVDIETRFIDEYPRIACVPPELFGVPVDCDDLDRAPFVYHIVRMYPYEIAAKYGDDALRSLEDLKNRVATRDYTADDVYSARLEDLGGQSFFTADDGTYLVYECYLLDPDTGQPLIVDICGSHVLDVRHNEYGRPPFVVATMERIPHRLIGRSTFDLVKDLQRLNSVLTRQVLDNIYYSNFGRYVAHPMKVSIEDLVNNNLPGGIIRGDPAAIKELLPPPLQPWTFKLLEAVQTWREMRTGVTRYNQGLDANSLNKTFRGMATIVNLSMQRMETIARLIAETAIAPLVKHIIDINLKFLQTPTALRIQNQWTTLSPDNIVGSYDVVVSVGLGTGNREQIIIQMQQLLGLMLQMMGAQLPIVTPDNLYHAMVELIKAMGYRDVDRFVTEPNAVSTAAPAVPGAVLSGMPGSSQPEQPLQAQNPGEPRTGITDNQYFA